MVDVPTWLYASATSSDLAYVSMGEIGAHAVMHDVLNTSVITCMYHKIKHNCHFAYNWYGKHLKFSRHQVLICSDGITLYCMYILNTMYIIVLDQIKLSLSVDLSIYLYICLSVCLSVCLYVYLSKV